jgi:uncharacterized coiled-coil DUF342 family protein
LINSSFDVDSVFPRKHRADPHLEILKSASNLSSKHQPIVGVGEAAALVESSLLGPPLPTQQEHPSQQLDLPEQLDVKAELDSLQNSWQLDPSHLPNSEPPDESGSISSILETIAATEPITHPQQLLQELKTTREQLNTAQTELQVSHQQHQARFDTSILQAKHLKFRTQQLAQHSKNQIEKVQEMLDSIKQIHAEIVTSLDKFGGYAEIHSMLVELETTRQALIIAHDRATTGQEAFYDSLQEIQVQVAAQSDESEHKLRQYHESIQGLSQTISIDRLRIAEMSVDISTKLSDLHGLNSQITTMHAQIVEKSQVLQARIMEIDRGFIELSQSVREEKEQFYALTVESIEKADIIRSQLTEIINQISSDRDSIAALKAEIASVRQSIRKSVEQQINNFDLRYQLTSTWNDIQIRQKNQIATTRKLSQWLWILSFVVGVIFILLVRMLITLK